jgi:hydroxymethylbilane synthase
MERADPRDVLIAKAQLDALPPGSRIGTGSLRRTIQLARVRPDINTCSIRGNIDTRLRKESSGEVDGIILAAAALFRLGRTDRITQYLPLDSFLPAAGQGALVIQTRSGDKDIEDIVLPVNHTPTWLCITAERAFLRRLGGGCRAPVAALGTINGTELNLEGMAASPDGKHALRSSIKGQITYAKELGEQLANTMLKMGASAFIDEARYAENG